MAKIGYLARVTFKDGSHRMLPVDRLNKLVYMCWSNKMEMTAVCAGEKIASVYQHEGKWHSYHRMIRKECDVTTSL